MSALGEKSLLELELKVASHAGVRGDSDTGAPALMTYEAEAPAHRLFARERWGFDSARLGRRARDRERRANGSSCGGRTEEEKKEGHDYEGDAGGGPGGGRHIPWMICRPPPSSRS